MSSLEFKIFLLIWGKPHEIFNTTLGAEVSASQRQTLPKTLLPEPHGINFEENELNIKNILIQ